MHDVCVIVVSYNGKSWLGPALTSLRAHSSSLDMDVVVVDNGSDGAAEYVGEEFPFARAIRCRNRGFGHANNRALETADARYILFLNPDTEVLEGELGDLVTALDERPEVGLAGVRQLRPDGALAPTIRRFPSSRNTVAESLGVEHVPLLRRFMGERVLDASRYGREMQCDWTSGSFMLVRSAVLDEVGWFDERFFLYSEETDLCWRIRDAGWKVVHMPTVTIRHDEGEAWVNSSLEAQSAYARMQFARKHFSRADQALYRFALAFHYLSRVALYSTLRRHENGHREALQASLDTVVRGRVPFEV